LNGLCNSLPGIARASLMHRSPRCRVGRFSQLSGSRRRDRRETRDHRPIRGRDRPMGVLRCPGEARAVTPRVSRSHWRNVPVGGGARVSRVMDRVRIGPDRNRGRIHSVPHVIVSNDGGHADPPTCLGRPWVKRIALRMTPGPTCSWSGLRNAEEFAQALRLWRAHCATGSGSDLGVP
jgi:hypothetical protein